MNAGACLSTALFITALMAGCDRYVHDTQLDVEFNANHVLPTFARTKDGKPFTGKVRATFGGEPGWLDCDEWKGAFKNGQPAGEFLLNDACGDPGAFYVYERGKWHRTRREE